MCVRCDDSVFGLWYKKCDCLPHSLSLSVCVCVFLAAAAATTTTTTVLLLLLLQGGGHPSNTAALSAGNLSSALQASCRLQDPGPRSDRTQNRTQEVVGAHQPHPQDYRWSPAGLFCLSIPLYCRDCIACPRLPIVIDNRFPNADLVGTRKSHSPPCLAVCHI